MEFRTEGVPAEITASRGNRDLPELTEVHLAWGTPHSLRVAPEDLTTSLRRLFGGNDLKLGHAEFDKAFWVEASNTTWAAAILDGDIRTRLLDLRSLGGSRNRICVDLNWVGVKARVFRHLGENEAALATVIEAAVALLLKARGPAPLRDVVLGLIQARPGICPVCSSPVSAKLVCPGCRTPHHADCWKYSGGCGIFACAGRARRARR